MTTFIDATFSVGRFGSSYFNCVTTGTIAFLENASFTQIKWSETLPANTDLVMAVRTGPGSPPSGAWVAYTDPAYQNLTNDPNNYTEVKAHLTRTTTGATPVLSSVTLNRI